MWYSLCVCAVSRSNSTFEPNRDRTNWSLSLCSRHIQTSRPRPFVVRCAAERMEKYVRTDEKRVVTAQSGLGTNGTDAPPKPHEVRVTSSGAVSDVVSHALTLLTRVRSCATRVCVCDRLFTDSTDAQTEPAPERLIQLQGMGSAISKAITAAVRTKLWCCESSECAFTLHFPLCSGDCEAPRRRSAPTHSTR